MELDTIVVSALVAGTLLLGSVPGSASGYLLVHAARVSGVERAVLTWVVTPVVTGIVGGIAMVVPPIAVLFGTTLVSRTNEWGTFLLIWFLLTANMVVGGGFGAVLSGIFSRWAKFRTKATWITSCVFVSISMLVAGLLGWGAGAFWLV